MSALADLLWGTNRVLATGHALWARLVGQPAMGAVSPCDTVGPFNSNAERALCDAFVASVRAGNTYRQARTAFENRVVHHNVIQLDRIARECGPGGPQRVGLPREAYLFAGDEKTAQRDVVPVVQRPSVVGDYRYGEMKGCSTTGQLNILCNYEAGGSNEADYRGSADYSDCYDLGAAYIDARVRVDVTAKEFRQAAQKFESDPIDRSPE